MLGGCIYWYGRHPVPDRAPVGSTQQVLCKRSHQNPFDIFKILQTRLDTIQTSYADLTDTTPTNMVQYAPFLLACLLGIAAAKNKYNTQVSDDGTLHCGIFGSGNKDKVYDLEKDLSGNLASRSWTIPPGGCNRVHCADTTGIYVCNVCKPWPLLPTNTPPPKKKNLPSSFFSP